MSALNWQPQQEAAIKAVQAWLKDRNHPQRVFRLFGWAGTGKTTLARTLAEDSGLRVHYASFTGKAALVMARKGCKGATTLHRTLYKKAYEDAKGNPTGWVLDKDGPLARTDLLVIDEVSMVGDDLASDVLSFGVKVLVLGDPFQLPPISGEGYFINAEPDVMLTEVHRFAAENPITALSVAIREGRKLEPGAYGECLVTEHDTLDPHQRRDLYMGADQVLCGLNRTRQALNTRIRRLKGLQGDPEAWMPVEGDRLVCLRNNHRTGLLNGGLWHTLEVQDKGDDYMLTVESEEGGHPQQVLVPYRFFQGDEARLKRHEADRLSEFTYAQALTCHKAQGSEWESVVVLDESATFGEHAPNWLYTAVTRASEKVTVLI